jgi:hypothetical protein
MWCSCEGEFDLQDLLELKDELRLAVTCEVGE